MCHFSFDGSPDRPTGRSAILAVSAVAMLCAAVQPAAATPPHESKEVAGLRVVFGAEPEPAITGEQQFLRWRFRTLEDNEPFAEIRDAEVTISKAGSELDTFTARGPRNDPGTIQTLHIFTAPGEYSTVLRFRKGDDPTIHTVDFDFRIRDRADLEIPAASGNEGADDAVVAALRAYAAAITAKEIDTLDALVTDDLLIFEGAGVDRGWAEYRDGHLAPELEMFESIAYGFDEIEVEVEGDLAWASMRYSVQIEMEDRSIDSGGVATAVLVRGDDGAWRMRHLHTTPERRRQ